MNLKPSILISLGLMMLITFLFNQAIYSNCDDILKSKTSTDSEINSCKNLQGLASGFTLFTMILTMCVLIHTILSKPKERKSPI